MAFQSYTEIKVNGAHIPDAHPRSGGNLAGFDYATWTEIHTCSFEVKTARDAASGRSTGRRQYSPAIFRKDVSKITPLLHKALVQNQNVDMLVKFFRSGDDGTQLVHYYSIKLLGGHIAAIKMVNPYSADAASADQDWEEFQVTFNEVVHTFVDGGVESVDNWMSNA